MTIQNLYTVLEERGFIEQITDDKLKTLFQKEQVPFYVGFDPTSDSLHLGHLVPVMALILGQKCGHKPIVLVGGATGMIGDPSGKSEERNLLTEETINANVAAVKTQLSSFLDFSGKNAALVVNNLDWIGKFSYIDWLREIGKNFTIANMMAKESVKKRMEAGQAGISYTEFSYQILQAYDFYHLYKEYGCIVQAGGSDQWGNITAGIDLVRKKAAAEVYGVTFPLLTTSTGEKFGKTAGNAVWLDENKTSVWDFYQYWFNTSDVDVIKYLKLFTQISIAEINDVNAEHTSDPGKRTAQKLLASQLTAMFHSKEKSEEVQNAAGALFNGNLADLPANMIKDVIKQGNAAVFTKNEIKEGIPMTAAFSKAGLVKSNSEARRKLKEGALYINDNRLSDEVILSENDILKDNIILLRLGKKKYALLLVNES